MQTEGLIQFNSWDFIFSMITFFVLFLILRHFLFQKVHDFMEKRSQEVQDTLDNAAETNRLAEEKLANYNEQIANVEEEGRAIIKNARDEAKTQAAGIVAEANEQAHAAIAHSQEEIAREHFNARKQLKEEVGTLAVMAAEKILEREISAEDHQDIVDQILAEAEEKPWS